MKKVFAIILALMVTAGCFTAFADGLSVDSLTATYVTSPLNIPSIVEKENGIFTETLGIPVLVERSSYEEHPLGRLEWIKLYGVLLGEEEMAEAFFEEQVEAVNQVEKKCEMQEQKKSVACFYVSANGYINVRKPGDYLTKMISIAGGSYALEGIELDEENALSTVNINWEEFYKEAIDADILIYNGTVDGGVKSIEELLAKNSLFADFKAVKEGNVWCTNMNLFQESSKIADIIMDFYAVISGDDAAQIQYMYQLY